MDRKATRVSSSADSACVARQAEVAVPAKPLPPVARPVPFMRDDTNGGVNTSVLRDVYIDFLQCVSFSKSWQFCNPELLDTVAEGMKANGGTHLSEGLIRLSAGFANLVYGFHPVDLQAKIGHFTALAIYVDDLAGTLKGPARERYIEDLRLFQMRFTDPEGYARRYPGRGDLHEGLEKFIVFLKTDQNPFLPTDIRLHSLMVKAAFDFIEANLQEQHYEEHPIEFTADMSQLPRFFRYKSGIAEVYAYCIIMRPPSSGSASQDEHFFYNSLYPMVPELIDCFDFGNDVLSFYKEMLQGENAIGIVSHSRIHSLPLLHSFRARVEAVILARTRAMALADRTGSDAIKSRIVTFFQGYMSWHLGSKRYRLDEILGGWYNGGSWL